MDTFTAAMQARPEREKKLRDAIQVLITTYSLDKGVGEKLFEALSARPAGVLSEEMYRAQGGDPRRIETPEHLRMTTEDSHRLENAMDSKMRLIEGGFEIIEGTPFNAPLSKNKKDSARRRKKKIETVAGGGFGIEGRPPYPHQKLVLEWANTITRLSGKDKFQWSHPGDGEKIGGPMMNVLLAALELALFASGAPSRETVVQIIRPPKRRSR